MPYCKQCGSKIIENAKFCTSCGSPVVPAGNSASMVDTVEAVSAGVDAKTTANSGAQNDTVALAGERAEIVTAELSEEKSTSASAEFSVAASSEATAETSADSTAASETTEAADSAQSANFKAAMDSSKRKSKRKIPMVVLVAIITMLTASVALAAYYVYTEVIVPQQEQAAQEAAEQERIEAEQSAIAQAEENYAPLLDEYRKIQEECAGRTEEENVEYFNQGEIEGTIEQDYPLITSTRRPTIESEDYEGNSNYPYYPQFAAMFDSGGHHSGGFGELSGFKYSFIDLNNDGNMEALIAALNSDGTVSGEVACYAYSDEKYITLAAYQGVWAGNFSITEDGYITEYGQGGFWIARTSLYAWDGNKLNEIELWDVDLVSGDDGAFSDQRKLTYTKNGETETKIVTTDELNEPNSSITSPIGGDHPQKTDFEWREF